MFKCTITEVVVVVVLIVGLLVVVLLNDIDSVALLHFALVLAMMVDYRDEHST